AATRPRSSTRERISRRPATGTSRATSRARTGSGTSRPTSTPMGRRSPRTITIPPTNRCRDRPGTFRRTGRATCTDRLAGRSPTGGLDRMPQVGGQPASVLIGCRRTPRLSPRLAPRARPRGRAVTARADEFGGRRPSSEENHSAEVLCVRKVVAYELLSLDGVAEDPDTYITEWDDAMDANLAGVIAAQDAVILGRRSFDEWAEF